MKEDDVTVTRHPCQWRWRAHALYMQAFEIFFSFPLSAISDNEKALWTVNNKVATTWNDFFLFSFSYLRAWGTVTWSEPRPGQSWPFYSLANNSDHIRNLVIQSNIMKRQLPGPHPFCYYYHTVIVSVFFFFLTHTHTRWKVGATCTVSVRQLSLALQFLVRVTHPASIWWARPKFSLMVCDGNSGI